MKSNVDRTRELLKKVLLNVFHIKEQLNDFYKYGCEWITQLEYPLEFESFHLLLRHKEFFYM